MKVQALHPNFQMPVASSMDAAGYDVYMVEGGRVEHGKPVMVGLGFATEIPEGLYAELLPRSSTGGKQGLELNNTMGIIDADYRGEWKASLNIKAGYPPLEWKAGDRLLQFILRHRVLGVGLFQVESVAKTERGAGGFGSTGA